MPVDGLSDAELLRRFLDYADREALATLFNRHRGLAYRTAWNVLQCRADAEDAVQEAFMALVRYAPRVHSTGSLAPLVARMALRAAQHLARAGSRRRTREESWAMPEEGVEPIAAETVTAVRNAVQQLDLRYRLPVVLHYFEGLSVEETAHALHISRGAARMKLSRALGKMREQLGATGGALSAAALISLLTKGQTQSPPPASLAGQLTQLAFRTPVPTAKATMLTSFANSAWWVKAGLAAVLLAAGTTGVVTQVHRAHLAALRSVSASGISTEQRKQWALAAAIAPSTGGIGWWHRSEPTPSQLAIQMVRDEFTGDYSGGYALEDPKSATFSKTHDQAHLSARNCIGVLGPFTGDITVETKRNVFTVDGKPYPAPATTLHFKNGSVCWVWLFNTQRQNIDERDYGTGTGFANQARRFAMLGTGRYSSNTPEINRTLAANQMALALGWGYFDQAARLAAPGAPGMDADSLRRFAAGMVAKHGKFRHLLDVTLGQGIDHGQPSDMATVSCQFAGGKVHLRLYLTSSYAISGVEEDG